MIFDSQLIFFFIKKALSYSFLFLLFLIFLIIYLQIKKIREKKENQRYQKFLTKYLNHKNFKKITFKKDRFFRFISFWNIYFNATENSNEKIRLVYIANKLNIPNLCISKIKSNIFRNTIKIKKTSLMIHTLGNVLTNHSSSTYIQKELEILLKSNQQLIVFETCIALLKINSKAYFEKVLHIILNNENWSNKELKYLMSFYNNEKALDIIFKLLEESTLENSDKIIEVASRTNNFNYYIDYILQNQHKFSIDSLGLAIKNIGKNNDFNLVEKFKENDNWIIHVSIIHAISSNLKYNENNLRYLFKNLFNSNWWIRNRAAQSIVQHYKNYDTINLIANKIEDKFAKESLLGALQQYNIN